jgi:hypothetical protein
VHQQGQACVDVDGKDGLYDVVSGQAVDLNINFKAVLPEQAHKGGCVGVFWVDGPGVSSCAVGAACMAWDEQKARHHLMLAGRAAWALAGWQRCASRPGPGTHPARLCATWPGLQQSRAGQGWLPQCSGGAQEQWRGFRGQRYTPPVCSSCCWLRLKVWMLTDSTDHPLMMSPLAGWYSCVPMAAADGRAYWQRVGEPCGA